MSEKVKLTGTLIPKDNKKAKMHAIFYYNKPDAITNTGDLSEKPVLPVSENVGFRYYATDIHKWITWDGSDWYYDDGTIVD